MLSLKIGHREIEDDNSIPSVSTYFDEEYLIKTLRRTYSLIGHEGCVNSLQWNKAGTLLASGSDDKQICIWRGGTDELLHKFATEHHDNIYSVNFLPGKNDEIILSGARDSLVQIHHIERGILATLNMDASVRRICTLDIDPNVFWVAAEDGFLRQVDTRTNEVDFLMTFPERTSIIKTMAVCNNQPFLMALGLQEAGVPVYDRRIPSRPFITLRSGDSHFFETSTTHIDFNTNGTEMVVDKSNGAILVFDVEKRKNPRTVQNANTLLDETGNFGMITRDTLPYEELRNGGKHFLAQRSYVRGIDYYGQMIKKRSNDAKFRSIIHSNRAICLLYRKKQGDNYHCFKECVKALQECQGNSKAVWRMAQCCVFMEDFELAKKCCEVFRRRFPKDNSIQKIENQLDLDGTKRSTNLPAARHDVMDYKERLIGHDNAITEIKQATFFGSKDQYIIAGSDCGGMFIWDRESSSIVGVWKGDSSNCNIVQPHPELPMIATSGFDHNIKLFQPALDAEQIMDEPEYGPAQDCYRYIDSTQMQRTQEFGREIIFRTGHGQEFPPNCVQS